MRSDLDHLPPAKQRELGLRSADHCQPEGAVGPRGLLVEGGGTADPRIHDRKNLDDAGQFHRPLAAAGE